MTLSWIRKRLLCLRDDERGAVSVVMGVALIPFVGALGIGFEVSNWYLAARGMQNAADAAAVAAATNGGANYDVEAKAVAAQYGFVHGANNISIAVSNTAACPGGGNTCYSVTISGFLPLYLSQVVGYRGDATLNGAAAKQLGSSAIAGNTGPVASFCLLALGPQGIRSNGAPKANLGCNVMSNSGATCNGHDLGAPIGAAHNTNSGCGVTKYSNVALATDIYAGLASNIPADPCGGSYPQEPGKKGTPLPPRNLWSGGKPLPTGNTTICGDLQLTGNVTISTTLGGPGAVLTIFNGQLDTNGFTISTTQGSGLTIVFSGTNGSYTHAPTGGGTIDIAAPTSGPWSGIAIYQDPKLTTGVDISAAGNSPTWNITGLIYLPNSSVTFSGAVNKSSNGKSCFAMTVKDITINGTGSILTNSSQCAEAGLTMPSTTLPGRPGLVS
jgi:hypothetical protein